MKEEAYRTYYELQALREKYKSFQSDEHFQGWPDNYWSDKIDAIDESMKIMIVNFKLTFSEI